MRRQQKLAQKKAKGANPVQQKLDLAVQHHMAGRLSAAEPLYRQVLQISPSHPVALHLLGVLAHQAGNNDAAVELIQKALTGAPDYVDAHYNLGNALKELGRLDDAVVSYKRAYAIDPEYVRALNNLGLTYQDLKQSAEAVSAYRRAIAVKPDYAEALFNLGNVLKELGDLEEAVKSYTRAVTLYPDYIKAHNNLGLALKELGRVQEAVDCYETALAISANEADVHYNLGVVLRELGQNDKALVSALKAFEITPDSLNFAISAHLYVPIIISSEQAIDHVRERYQAGLEFLKNNNGPFFCRNEQIDFHRYFLAYHNANNADFNADLSRFVRKNFDVLNMDSPHLGTWQPPSTTSRPIRVGLLSEFFRSHTIGKLYKGLIQNLDRRRFEVVLIHTPETKEDAFCRSLDDMADVSLTLPFGVEQQQQIVSAEHLDVLFYPDIGMVPSSYLLAHARLAPVQLVSWGHPDTTGVDTLDYFVSARSVEPDSAPTHYTETLIQLNRLPCFYPKPEIPVALFGREALGLPQTGTVYGCPQTLYKFHPDFDAILSDIATGDPDGWIVLIEGRVSTWADLLRARWKKTAPALLERVVFLPSLPFDRFMSLLHNTDVLLDPVHFGSGNTLYEAMALGTPIVTCPGQFMRSRIVSGAYAQMHIEEPPVAQSLKDYAPLALALGRDPDRRHKLRERLIEAADRALFSDSQAVREFEDFLEASVAAAGQGKTLTPDWRPNTADLLTEA